MLICVEAIKRIRSDDYDRDKIYKNYFGDKFYQYNYKMRIKGAHDLLHKMLNRKWQDGGLKFKGGFVMAINVIETALDIAYDSMERGKGRAIRQVIPFFWSSSGAGKTQQVAAWARRNDFYMNSVHLGSMEAPGDLIGMMDVDPVSKKSFYNVPDWFRFNHPRVLVFIDEANRGNLLMQQALIPILGDYMVGPYMIPDHVMFVLAGNPPTQEYNVTDLDEALIQRCMHVSAEPNLQQFLKWADDNMQQELVDFIEFHMTSSDVTKQVISLGESGKKTGKVWMPEIRPSGKSWEMINIGYRPNMTKMELKLLFDGLAGPGVFEVYWPYLKDKERPLNPAEVLTNYGNLQGRILKWGSTRHNRIDLLDLTLQRLARYINSRKKAHAWAYILIAQMVQGILPDNRPILNSDFYSLFVGKNHRPKQQCFISLLFDLSGENLRSLQTLLDVSV